MAVVAELPLCVFSPEQVVTGEVPAPTVEAAVSVKLLIDTAELQTFLCGAGAVLSSDTVTTLLSGAVVLAAVHKDMLELTAKVGPEPITGSVASAVQHDSKASAFVMDDDVVASVFTGVIALLVALMETVTATVVLEGTVSTTLLQLEGTAESSLSVVAFAIWVVFLLLSADAGNGEALLLGEGAGEAKLEVKVVPEDITEADKI